MLSRAVNSYEPSSQRGKLPSQLSPSSPPASLDDILKPKKQAQQTIGGFAGVKNKSMGGQQPARVDVQKYISKIFPESDSRKMSDMKGSAARLPPMVRKRHSSEISTGLAATLGSSGSFSVKSNIIDLTQEDPDLPPHSFNKVAKPNVHVEFNVDDFEDDDELDLDIEYPTGLPLSSARKPLKSLSQNIAPIHAPALTLKRASPDSPAHPSSAITWPSSPERNKRTPPGSKFQQQPDRPELRTSTVDCDIPDSSEPVRDAKRRTLPWLQKHAEGLVCGNCGEDGHEEPNCTNEATKSSKIDASAHQVSKSNTNERHDNTLHATPNIKGEKSQEYFNTTPSALEARTQALRERNKVIKQHKAVTLSSEEQQDIIKMTTKKARAAPIMLSDEQKNVVKLVCTEQQSVFFTGSAGTGKSVLMRAIISDLHKIYQREPDRVAVTASTGLAACNIGGVTLHSFAGIGLGKESVNDLCKKIAKNAKARTRWLRTKILVIDEISMVDGDLFDKLEEIARRLRKNGRPFGGIQLVITGDFFQLPPVPDYGKQAKFAFDANTWSTSISHTIGLTEVFRQRDPEFAQMLNEMRLGKISDQTIRMFKALDRKIGTDFTEATELFPTRNEVDNANSTRMRSLEGTSFHYLAQDTGRMQDVKQRDKLLSNVMAPQSLELKKGSQVMLIKNMDDSLVNGSLGLVMCFMSEKEFTHYTETDELPNGHFEGQPVKQDSGVNKLKSRVNPHLVGDTSRLFPLVRFKLADGTSRDLLCQREEWKIELPNGEIQAQRSQLPLILAWALSIHKAQGQTLERVTVDLRKVFENGQAYVALSRATTKEGLEVRNFSKKAIMAHPKVAQFYDGLYSVNKAMMHPKVADAVPSEKTRKERKTEVNESDLIIDHSMPSFDEDEEAMAAYM